MAAAQNFDALKGSLRQHFDEARRRTDALFDIITPQAFYERPIDARHRIIFYLGHLETFDWNLICRTSFEERSLHSEFERLFAFGIDPVDGKLPQDKPSDWPAITTVRQYNVLARQAVDDCLNKADFSHPQQPYVENGLIFWAAIEHRLMHLETLSYMLHWLPFDLKHPRNSAIPDTRPAPAEGTAHVPAGQAIIGIQRNGTAAFGWDNEFEGQIVDVPEFEIDRYKVSNQEFLKFVEAGGYDEKSLWDEGAWQWITSEGIRHPKFWTKRGSAWMYRSMFREIPFPGSWPVYVSHAEASAYARWKGKRLPTEPEFHRAALDQKGRGNLGLNAWDPVAVNANEDAKSAFGVVEMVGNGWEWTGSLFAPLPGFQRFPFYPGYSADFFDNKHFVLKGASARTAVRLARPSFRNWFQPHYPYIYAGFRCVER